ncbi:transcriptional regulator [Chitinimonas arctica]|nr:YdaS family helix-turn-helix protein [Chitinimonas arctica]
MKTPDTLAHLVAEAGGQKAFGELVGASQATISKLLSGACPGPELAVAIERATEHRISRPQLRPADWHLIWPELVPLFADRMPVQSERQAA